MAVGLKLKIDVDDKGTPKVTRFQNRWDRMRGAVLRGTERMGKAWQHARRAFGNLQQHIQRGAKIAALALAGLATAAIVVGAKFEQGMAKVASVAGASRAELQKLSMVARAWGARTAFSATQVTDAMYSLASAGQKTGEIIKSVGGVLMYAGAAATSMGEAAESVVQTLKMFGLAATQANRVVNVLAAGISASMLNADRLKESMAQVGATASAMNMTLEETVGTLGLLHNAGMLGGIAGTRLKNVLARLAAPTGALKKMLGDVSLETDGLAGVMQHLADRGTKAGEVFQSFGRIAAPAVLVMMKAGRAEMERMTEAVTGTRKAFEMYKQQQNTVMGDFKRFRSAIEETFIATFEALRPRIRRALQTMITWVEKSRGPIVATVEAIGVAFDNTLKTIKTVFFEPLKKSISTADGDMRIFAINTERVFLNLSKIAGFFVEGFAGIGERFEAAFKVEGFWDLMKQMAGGSKHVREVAESQLDASEASEILTDRLELLGAMANILGGKPVDDIALFSRAVTELAKMPKIKMDIELPSVDVDLAPKMKPIMIQSGLVGAFTLPPEFYSSIEEYENSWAAATQRVQGKRYQADIVSANQEIANLMRLNAERYTYESEWLTSKKALLEAEHQERLMNSSLTASEIAASEIEYSRQVMLAEIAHRDAVWQHWQDTHQMQMALFASLSAGYDTLIQTSLDMEMTGKKRREAIWDSMKRSFVGHVGAMLKFYVKEWFKSLLINQAASESFHMKEKLMAAKSGAVKAYSAFASIPIIGPALGAAAAAAAFAFLIAFHKGGLVGQYAAYSSKREVPALLEEGEHVTRRRSVTRETLPVLEHINRTGTAPTSASISINVPINAQGTSGGDVESLRDDIEKLTEDVIAPALEDLLKRRRYKVSMA